MITNDSLFQARLLRAVPSTSASNRPTSSHQQPEMLGFRAAKVAKATEAAKRKREEVTAKERGKPQGIEAELEDEQPLQRRRSAELPTIPTLPSSPIHPTVPVTTTASSSKSHEKCPDLQRLGVEELVGRRPEVLLDFLWAPSSARESVATLPYPLREFAVLMIRSWNDKEQHFLNEMPIGENVLTAWLYCHRAALHLHMSSVVDKVKTKLDSMLELKAKAEKLFTEVEAERLAFAKERRGYEDRLNKMGEELDACLSTEHKLLDENKAL